jgi:hypothetical protein
VSAGRFVTTSHLLPIPSQLLLALGALVNVLPQNIEEKLWKERQIFHNVLFQGNHEKFERKMGGNL